jgi:hypothetical protein
VHHVRIQQQKSGLQDSEQQLYQFTAMLDHVDNLIMLADTSTDNVIFYMNRTARDVLAHHRSAMNAKFRAGVDVNNAFQHSIHQFHRDPDRIRRILQDIAARRISHHEALIPVAGVTFKTKVFPIWDARTATSCSVSWPAFRTFQPKWKPRRCAMPMTNVACFWKNVLVSLQAMCRP